MMGQADIPIDVLVHSNDRDIPDDYRTNFDRKLAVDVLDSLEGYLRDFADASKQVVKFNRTEDNELDIGAEDNSSMVIQCFASDIFDLQRWYSTAEIVDGKLGFEFLPGADDHAAAALSRRYITTCRWEDPQ